MSATRIDFEELERLVDRHIELSELFDEQLPTGNRASPRLVTMSEGKAVWECFADLVDRALVAYEGSGFSRDSTIYALKTALVQAILDMS